MTRELLSEVLGWDVINVESGEHFVFYFDTLLEKRQGINTYELAHKCKEWANFQENCFSIASGKIPANYFCVLSYTFGWLGTNDYEKFFRADTEPDAIFQACEWILKQKGIEL